MNNDDGKTACRSAYDRLQTAGLISPESLYLVIDVATQAAILCRGGEPVQEYPVSTAARGTGCRNDSYQTPTGLHRIAEKHGDDQPPGMIFEGRVATGRIAAIEHGDKDTGLDLITSRILWLDGMEPGLNRGNDVDSYARYIYLHGTNEEGRLGKPVSHGCIRMSNRDIIALYGQVDVDTPVIIV